MRRKNTLAVAVTVLLGLAAIGCGDNPVGRICFIGVDAGNDTQAIIASPALECPSRTCLHQPLQGQLPEGSTWQFESQQSVRPSLSLSMPSPQFVSKQSGEN